MHSQGIAGLGYQEYVKFQTLISLQCLWRITNYSLFLRQIHPFPFMMEFWTLFNILVLVSTQYEIVAYATYSPNSSLRNEYTDSFKPCIHMYNNAPMISACYGNQLQYYSCSAPYQLLGECSFSDALLVHEEHALYNRNASLVATNKGIAMNQFSSVF